MTWNEIGISEYKQYFNTRHWKRIKNRYIKHNKNAKCYVCNSKRNLLLHHVSYQNLGAEELNKDIYIVCYDCHQVIHYLFFFVKIPLVKQTLLSRMYYAKAIHLIYKFKIIKGLYYLLKSFYIIFS